MPAWTPTATLLLSYGRTTRGTEALSTAVTHRASAHVLLGFGIAGWAQIDVDLPITLYQQARHGEDDLNTPANVSSLGDLRIGAKGTILRTPRRGFGLGVALDVTAPTGDPSALSGWGGPSVAPMVLVERSMVLGMLWSANVGYWARPNIALGDAIVLRTGLRVPIAPREQFSALGEVESHISTSRGGSSPLSIRGGFRWQLRSGVTLAAYGGGAAIPAVGVPDVQGLFTVGYAPPKRTHAERAFSKMPAPSATEWARRSDRRQDPDDASASEPPAKIDPADPDGDGITSLSDRCPTVREDFDGFEDDDGCPELDNDRDGLRDRDDLCPNAPEVINGYLDGDGCPDRRLAHGGETFLRFDARRIVPHLRFAPQSAELSEETRVDLDELAELLRLNPWIERLGLTVYVVREDRPDQEHQLAQAQAEAIVQYLVARDVEPWRIQVSPARALPPGTEARVRLTLTTIQDGLRPLAPADAPRLAQPPAVEPSESPSATEPATPGPVVEAQGPSNEGSRRTHPSTRR